MPYKKCNVLAADLNLRRKPEKWFALQIQALLVFKINVKIDFRLEEISGCLRKYLKYTK